MPRHPQPVPPIYNPEIAARAVYWAAHHNRREVHVGITTVATILGQKLAPGLLDRYLGRTGYKSQQTETAVQPDRPDNLVKPVPGDFAAHGSFDQSAADRSPEVWLTTHRAASLGVSLLSLGLVFAGLRQLLRG